MTGTQPSNTRSAARLFIAALTAWIGVGAGAAHAAARFDPALRFRVLRTPHFRIHFHHGTDLLALRLADIAEDVWQRLERPLGRRPPPLTHVVVADQSELPNAYATPLPYDTIVIFPTWPPGSEFDTDDWLRLVFTHEFTHIGHLDRSESWARVVRGLFGRTFVAFPNLFLPTWQIEGLATYEESALTGEGRLHAGEFRAIVDEAARTRRLLPLDRVNGGLTDWPGGQAPYAYGAAFHEYLADRFGVERLGELADATARRIPYTAAPAFSKVFGQSLGRLWRDFESTRLRDAAAEPSDPGARRLTRTGFVVAAPRFDRSCGTCPASIVYAERTPHAFPALKRIAVEGGKPATLTTRYFGAATALGPTTVFFDQLEVARTVGLYGDLYALSRESGRVTRLTRGARLHDPDLSPDGSTIAAVQERGSRRDLVLVKLTAHMTIEPLISSGDTQFNAPRWSPDGRRIAVERHRLGSDPEIVIVDLSTRAIRVLASRPPGARVVMPAWRPDGRGLLAAVAIGDGRFNIVELDLDRELARPVTHTAGGATWPELSADGRTLVFVGYTTDGYDLFAMPYAADPSVWQGTDVTPAHWTTETADASWTADRVIAGQSARGEAYSPLPTLRPTSWSPIIESDSGATRAGAATTGTDVLGYHFWAASVSWLVSTPADAIVPNRGSPDWFVSYAYDRWQPTLFAAASVETSFFAGPATAAGTPSAATRREHQFEAGVLLPRVRARSSHAALATFFRSADDYALVDRELRRDRAALRTGWRSITARTYGYSVSPEDGVAAGGTAEFVRSALGASADATTLTGDLRAYLPGLGRHHVVAGRVAAGVSRGDRTVGRTFLLGGPGPDANVSDFGSSAISVLRGFAANSFAGSHVAVAAIEYRLPLIRPQRGVGTWPVFLHTLHASAAIDAGLAWTQQFALRDLKTSIGAELSASTVLGYYFPLTVSLGVARGHDGSRTLPDATAFYMRIGRAF